jgi:hypothetical protein
MHGAWPLYSYVFLEASPEGIQHILGDFQYPKILKTKTSDKSFLTNMSSLINIWVSVE